MIKLSLSILIFVYRTGTQQAIILVSTVSTAKLFYYFLNFGDFLSMKQFLIHNHTNCN